MNYPTLRRISFRLATLSLASVSWMTAASGQQQQTPPVNSGEAISDELVPFHNFEGFHEDWNSLSLKTSNLVEQPVVPGQVEDMKDKPFVRERYQVAWRPGDAMDLYVIRPRGVANPPVILFLYSYPQDTERFKNDGWCARVTSGGYAAVGFVSALTGHRYHDRPMKEWFISELREALVKSVHDVQMILSHLEDRGDLNTNRVAMFGQGSGGTVAVLAAAVDPRIRVLEIASPWGDWPEWFAKSPAVPEAERANYLTTGYQENIASLDPVRWLPKVKAKKLRIQNVREDQTVPTKCQIRLEKAAPLSTRIDQFGDGRAYAAEFAGGKLFDWMKQQLQPNTNANDETSGKTQRVRYYPPQGQSIR
jgi:pimeloyl-ACP methyl ester carboxylesterase